MTLDGSAEIEGHGPSRSGPQPAVQGRRSIPWRRSLVGGALTAWPVVLFGIAVLLFAPPWIERLAYAGLVALVVVTGLQIFMGNSQTVNFANTVFFGVGAYAVAILSTPLAMKKIIIPNAPFGLAEIVIHPVIAASIGLLVVGFVALVTGLVIVRVIGIAADILTLCMQIVFHSVFIHWTDLFKGNTAFFGIPQVLSLPAAIAIAAAALMIARLFKDSPWGVQLRAAAQNHLAARTLGVNVPARRLVAWILGAVVCGIAGMMYALYIGTINARSFYFGYVFLTIAMLILGGMRTVSGVVVGVAVIEVGIELIRMLENSPVLFGVKLPEMFGLSGAALGAVIVLCMALRPSGLMGNSEFDDLLLRWLRRRRGDTALTATNCVGEENR